MIAPLPRETIEAVAAELARRLYPLNPRPREALASRIVEAMAAESTREAQDAAGSRVLAEIREAQPVRSCRLSDGECARRCDVLPGGCDVYGDGLVSDGIVTRVVGRRFDGEALELTMVGEEPQP